MNDTDLRHPARSSDFLSRLHDGEISAAQASAFESHRAGCAECREAAETFAQSLAAFRSAEPAPAAADLSARILRKIRAQSPSRRPFGIMFGIDVRWAGVVVAALLVVLISAPALLRRPDAGPVPAAPTSLAARIVDAAPAKEMDVVSTAQPKAESRADKGPAAAPPPPAPALARDEAAAKPQIAAAAEAPAEEERTRSSFAPAPRAKAAAPAPRRHAAAAEPSGGEAGAANLAETVVLPPRVTVRALDGQGAAPALTSLPSDERFAPLCGREFVLVVETQGRVRDVRPSSSDGFLARQEAEATLEGQSAAIEALRALCFAPGDRPRRLLVRIE